MYNHLFAMGGATKMSEVGSSNVTTGGLSPFQASRGWLDCFKKQYGLKVKLTGERASVDHGTTEAFPAQLTQLIEGVCTRAVH